MRVTIVIFILISLLAFCISFLFRIGFWVVFSIILSCLVCLLFFLVGLIFKKEPDLKDKIDVDNAKYQLNMRRLFRLEDGHLVDLGLVHKIELDCFDGFCINLFCESHHEKFSFTYSKNEAGFEVFLETLIGHFELDKEKYDVFLAHRQSENYHNHRKYLMYLTHQPRNYQILDTMHKLDTQNFILLSHNGAQQQQVTWKSDLYDLEKLPLKSESSLNQDIDKEDTYQVLIGDLLLNDFVYSQYFHGKSTFVSRYESVIYHEQDNHLAFDEIRQYLKTALGCQGQIVCGDWYAAEKGFTFQIEKGPLQFELSYQYCLDIDNRQVSDGKLILNISLLDRQKLLGTDTQKGQTLLTNMFNYIVLDQVVLISALQANAYISRYRLFYETPDEIANLALDNAILWLSRADEEGECIGVAFGDTALYIPKGKIDHFLLLNYEHGRPIDSSMLSVVTKYGEEIELLSSWHGLFDQYIERIENGLGIPVHCFAADNS